MNVPLRVLLIEDSDDDAELVVRTLRRGGYDLTYTQVESAETMHEALARHRWDLVISDYSMPQFNAPAALQLLHEVGMDLPFIIVSGTIGEETAVAAMKAGAHDFLMKGNLTRLIPAIARELREAAERRERRRAEARFAGVLDATAEAIIAINEDQRIVLFNASAERIFGYTAAEAHGQPLDMLLPQRLIEAHQHYMSTFVATPDSSRSISEPQGEFVGRRKDGTEFPLEASIATLSQERETIFTVFLQDISARKQADLQIQRQLQRLAALRAIDLAITASLDLRVTLNVVLDQVITHLAVDAANVLLLDPYMQTLDYAAGRGFRTTALHHTQLRLGEGYAGLAALERRLIHIPSLGDAEGFRRASLFLEEGFVSYYGVPLVAKGQVQGVLEVFHRTSLAADQEWHDFLETLGGQAAIAIDNATLFDDLQQANRELIRAYDTTLEGWSRALDLRDKETEGHTQRVTELTVRLARALGISGEELLQIRRGALLHDIGKMGVPDGILLKPGPLTEEEWVSMRKHPGYAYELLAPIGFLRPALEIPYCHHEKWDGTGYPRGLRGEQIPRAARIFAVIDVWDAMRSDRPYRKGRPEAEVRDHIQSLAGTHFDPTIVQAFLELAL
jgi:PAS domain S-box-containing protein